MARRRRAFTQEEIDLIVADKAKGMSWKGLARKYRRTPGTIEQKLKRSETNGSKPDFQLEVLIPNESFNVLSLVADLTGEGFEALCQRAINEQVEMWRCALLNFKENNA